MGCKVEPPPRQPCMNSRINPVAGRRWWTWAVAAKIVKELIHLDRGRNEDFSVHPSCDFHAGVGYLFVPGSFMPGAFLRADRPYRHEPINHTISLPCLVCILIHIPKGSRVSSCEKCTYEYRYCSEETGLQALLAWTRGILAWLPPMQDYQVFGR